MKHKITVLTEEDILRMDANRKPKNFFAFIRASDGDISGYQAHQSELSRDSAKRQEGALESLESVYCKRGGNL